MTRIDGRALEPQADETILVAAQRAGIAIPALCAVPGLAPEGSCRLCIVETGDGAIEAACHTTLRPGMQVRTDSPRLRALRRGLLELVVASVPHAGLAPRADGNELERLLAEYGVAAPASETRPQPDASHPYLLFDAARCIACRRCVHACDEIQGERVYAAAGRAGAGRIVYGPGARFAQSACTACGACVDVCPTGAVSDRDRRDPAPALASVRSTCGYCGVGCQVEIEAGQGRVLRISGVPQAAVNHGHLCAKGRYAHAYQHAPDRLRRPLRRRGDGSFEEIAWPEAIRWLAARLTALRDRFGPDALGALTSSRSTNEAAYLLQKLFRTRIGTHNVDCCARVCHSSTAAALRTSTGTGAASACYADIERAERIVVAGANPTEAHPVLGARIRQRVRAGARLLVIDPRRIELVDDAELHLQLRPGSNVALFQALAKLLLENGDFDARYAAERLDGLDALREALRGESLRDSEAITGVSEDSLHAAARFLAAGPALFVHGLGLSELVQGTASVLALCNLGMLTGSLGRPGAGMLPLRGQNNVQGNADMGAAPTFVTGYQSVSDAAARARFAALWGTELPARPGLTLPRMLDAAVSGELRALWIQGEDVAQSDPHESHVLEALSRLELLVVQELFLTGTARHAHLVLPAAGALEQDGTFTNAERRIQRVRAAVPPPGEARPDWEVIRDVACALGAGWRYAAPGDVMDEIARACPELFGGVSYDRLEGDGLQWPCPDRAHPGSERLHERVFLGGRGRLSDVAWAASPEAEVPGFPFALITGRVLQHYNVGTLTRRTPNLELAPRDALEIHPQDAAPLGVADGDDVEVESRWGRTHARARLSDRVARGTLFLSFHHPETHANRLTGPQRDPESDCPEYKLTAVRLRPAAPPGPAA